MSTEPSPGTLRHAVRAFMGALTDPNSPDERLNAIGVQDDDFTATAEDLLDDRGSHITQNRDVVGAFSLDLLSIGVGAGRLLERRAHDGGTPAAVTDEAREHCTKLAVIALRDALDAVAGNEDASIEISLAQTAWKVVLGEATADEIDDMLEYRISDDGGSYWLHRGDCICPPALLKRGGFRGGCPEHA